jgi:TATA-binding protein-associated factor Taf7
LGASSQSWQTGVSRRGIVGPDGLRTFEGVEPMGRGRAKAKQVKVARQLKYNSGGTDLDRLRAELAAERGGDNDSGHAAYDAYDDDDAADDELDDDEDEDDEDSWTGRSGRPGGR